MAVPKRKKSRANTHSRRSMWKTTPTALTTCGNKACGAPVRPHTACTNCGHYAARQVLEV